MSFLILRRARTLSVGLALLVPACIGRPEGAYRPLDESFDDATGFIADAGVDSDAGPRAGLPTTGGIIGDADAADLTPEQRALLPLTGRYALRADMFSVVKLDQLFAQLEVENTATHLSVAEVSLNPQTGKLQMTERLCYQRYAHRCIAGCSTWSSEMDARVTAFFPYTEHVIEVAGERFSSDLALTALGYDGSPFEMPAGKSDARVWNVSGDDGVREGVMTRIVAEGTPVGTVDCVVYSVQRFATAFEGTLSSGKLDGVVASLDTTGSDARRLGAAGPNASSCEGDAAAAQPGTAPSTLRFARIPMDTFSDEAFWSCPSELELEATLRP